MHPIEQQRRIGGRRGARLIAILLLSLGLAICGVPRAHAEPSTNDRRVVAEEVAASVCRSVPSIPKLPSKVDPHHLCQSVLVENIDPDGNNKGIRTACQLALPGLARAAVPFCARVMDQILDPARKLFLDKVAPAAQQLACVTSAPAAFDCLAQQVHVWLKQSIISLWQGLITVLTGDTKAIALLDHWHHRGVVSLYSDVGAVGATLLLGLMLTSLIVSAIRFDFRQFGHTLLGVVAWGMFWSGGAAVAVLLLKASDDASRWLAGRADGSGTTDLDRAGRQFSNWVDYVTAASPKVPGTVHPTYDVGSFTAILICLLLVVAVVVTLVALLMRNIALLLIVVLLPLTLAGAAGPRMTREWFLAALRMFVALLLAKPLIVVAVRLGALLVSVPNRGETQATFSDALLGIAIILLAGLLPGVIYRFSGGLMQTGAGAPPRASGGFSEQSTHSLQSGMDMTRIVMERNAPRPTAARPAGAFAQLSAQGATGMGSVGGHTAGASLGSLGGRTAGTPLGSVGGRTAAASLGGVAGPLGLAAMGTAVAGGALESGGRWMGAHAATAGGVVGDVEAPRVPTPPVSRLGYYGRTRPATVAAGSENNRSVETQPQRAQVTLLTAESPTPPRTPLPPAHPSLVIPGSVVPEREQPVLPAAPKALPPGKADQS